MSILKVVLMFTLICEAHGVLCEDDHLYATYVMNTVTISATYLVPFTPLYSF